MKLKNQADWLLKFYDFLFKKNLDNAIHIIFDLVFLIDWADYFLTYGNVKMAMIGNL